MVFLDDARIESAGVLTSVKVEAAGPAGDCQSWFGKRVYALSGIEFVQFSKLFLLPMLFMREAKLCFVLRSGGCGSVL